MGMVSASRTRFAGALLAGRARRKGKRVWMTLGMIATQSTVEVIVGDCVFGRACRRHLFIEKSALRV